MATAVSTQVLEIDTLEAVALAATQDAAIACQP
jgi:hypothetical protein